MADFNIGTEEDLVLLTIDGREVTAKRGLTIFELAGQHGIFIPSLCAHPDLRPVGTCGLCIVEVDGGQSFPTSCTTLVEHAMVVKTMTPDLTRIRREALEVILAQHPYACLTCEKKGTVQCSPVHLFDQSGPRPCSLCPQGGRCELEKIVDYIGIKEVTLASTMKNQPLQTADPLFERDYNLCIVCGRCVRVCHEVRGVGAIDFVYDADGKVKGVSPISEQSYLKSGCKFCGACVEVCPTGALCDKQGSKLSVERKTDLVPCQHHCPAGVDIPRFVYLIGQSRFQEAVAVLREKLPFPGVLGRVCHHPCEASCRRMELNGPLNIKALKRFVVEQDTGAWRKIVRLPQASNKSVAVVGSGPAGLTAAYVLALLGHAVTVFEELEQPGGMMRFGIPCYRLPREVLEKEIEYIRQVNVSIQTGVRINSLSGIFEKGFKAVFLATGASQSLKLDIEGEDIPGVMQGIDFLREVNSGKAVSLGDRVAVIGGGNVAMDAARLALRTGSKQVTVIYRRNRSEMPATLEEIKEAEGEGVEFIFYTVPAKINRHTGEIGLECIKLRPGKKWDSQGRRLPVPIPGSQYTMCFDSVIVAIGQQPEIPDGFGITSGEGGIKVNPDTLETNLEGVFAGGDAVSGSSSVIEAVAAGRLAASFIDKYLGGMGILAEAWVPAQELEPWLGRDDGFIACQRVGQPLTPFESRCNNFNEIVLGLSAELAVREAQRCLRCSLRFKISRVIEPPVRSGN